MSVNLKKYLKISLIFSYFIQLRLFILMGVTWVAEGISWYTEAGKNDDTVLFMVFRIFDLINCAQGIIILIIHLMKRKHLADLRRRLQRLIQQ
jgi:hypothetical protein